MINVKLIMMRSILIACYASWTMWFGITVDANIQVGKIPPSNHIKEQSSINKPFSYTHIRQGVINHPNKDKRGPIRHGILGMKPPDAWEKPRYVFTERMETKDTVFHNTTQNNNYLNPGMPSQGQHHVMFGDQGKPKGKQIVLSAKNGLRGLALKHEITKRSSLHTKEPRMIKIHQKYNITVSSDIMFPYTINNPDLCQRKEQLHHVILVMSSPYHFNERQVIRQTWAQNNLLPKYLSQTVFIVEKSPNHRLQSGLLKEFGQHGDIVQADYTDRSCTDTLNSLIGLKWVMEYCMNTKYVIRVNDNIFIDQHMFVEIFKHKFSHVRKSLIGLNRCNISLIRSSSGECYHSKCFSLNDYEHLTQYPIYVGGSMFVATPDSLQDMYEHALDTDYSLMKSVFLTDFIRATLKDVNIFYLDSYIELGNMRSFINQFTKASQTSKEGPFFATMSSLMETSCMWALRLQYMTEKEIIVIGGRQKYKDLWQKLASIKHFMPKYAGQMKIQSEHEQAVMFSVGQICSFMFYFPQNEKLAYKILTSSEKLNEIIH